MTDPNTILEETWWEIQTTTGLTLQLPAPSRTIDGEPLQRLRSMVEQGEHGLLVTESAIDGKTYALVTSHILFVKEFARTNDPERLVKAQMRASRPSLVRS